MLSDLVLLFVAAILPAFATAGEITALVCTLAFRPRVTLSFARSAVLGSPARFFTPAIPTPARGSRAPPRGPLNTQ